MRTRNASRHAGWLVTAAFLMAITSLFGAQPTAAAARKLNGNLAIGGSIDRFVISPDGSKVVYLADQTTSGVTEVYSAPIGGGTPTKLNGALPSQSDVKDFAVSPDSSTVVYLANQNDKDFNEIFSVPISGGTPIRLNGLLNNQTSLGEPGGDVISFKISPDSSTVIYRADQSTNQVFELYSVSITRATTEQRLNTPLAPGHNVQPDFAITPDGQRVVYRADQNTTSVIELFSVPLTGGATPAQLSPSPAPLTADVPDFTISPDSSRVIFRDNFTNVGVLDLYNAAIVGGTTFPLTTLAVGRSVDRPPPAEGRAVLDTLPYAVTPDSVRVIFIADAEATDNDFNVYSIPIGGGVRLLLSTFVGLNMDVTDFVISPNSQRVIYRADAFIDQNFELVTVLADGTGSENYILQGVILPLGGNIEEFAISPDSSRVVFRGDFNTNDLFELASSPVDGSLAPQKLNGSLAPNGDVGGDSIHSIGTPFAFAIAPNSSRVVYLADQDVDNVFEIYSVLLTGGLATKLNGNLVNNGAVTSFAISPNSSRVVYLADQSTDQVFNLYSVPTPGGTRTSLTSTTSAVSGDVLDFTLSPNGAYAVYRADENTDDVCELYSVSLPNGTPVKLNGDLGGDGDVGNPNSTFVPISQSCTTWGAGFTISPDSQRVVYLADQDTNDVLELYSVPIGGGAPVKLNPPLIAGGEIIDFKISPNSQRVIYRAAQETLGIYEIYSVPISGGTAQRLSSVLTTFGFVYDYAISPNSQRVVYLADQATPGIIELYSVVITGGSSAPLNSTLPTFGSVRSFAISADSSRVAYVADQNTAGTFEIYSVPLNDGAVTRLNSVLQASGNVATVGECAAQIDPNLPTGTFFGPLGFAISPDSSRVVYCADQDSNDVFEIYSVPLTGGTPAKLNLPPGIGGDVLTFAISPNSQRAVYIANQNTAAFELFSAPLVGGSNPVKLNGTLVAGGNVDSFKISPDSSRVAYVADDRILNAFDLLSVPLAGGTSARLSRQIPGDLTDVDFYEISADSQRVVYVADQNTDNVSEVYTVPLSGTRGSQLLNDVLATGSNVFGFAIQSTTAGIVYYADQITKGVDEIFYTAFPSPPSVVLPPDQLVDENAGVISLPVRLTDKLSTDVTIGFVVSGAATLGDDYNISSTPLTFPANTTVQTITLTIKTDTLVEADEPIIITFNTPSANLVLPDPPRTTVTIKGIVSPPDPPLKHVYLPLIAR